MYFLRASYKSPQMFLAGYFIGASDRWSRWNKKMVCSLLPPPPSLLLLVIFKNFYSSLKCIVKTPFPFPSYIAYFCTSYWTQVKIYITAVLFNTYQELWVLSALLLVYWITFVQAQDIKTIYYYLFYIFVCSISERKLWLVGFFYLGLNNVVLSWV